MEIISKIIIALVAFEHLYILYMEMFAWETLGKNRDGKIIHDEPNTPITSE